MRVIAVASSPAHTFSKPTRGDITLRAGLGVDGDVHAAATIRARTKLGEEIDEPNLRQVHLQAQELHEELAGAGYPIEPGQLGENITTRGVDLQGLPAATRLRIGESAVVELTGLRTPCHQVNKFRAGLMKQMVGLDADGNVVRKAGVLGVVVTGGVVRPGDPIEVELPDGPHSPQEPI
ncbi:MOSC domain-containing protein [Herbihabitans rhizosphaerae]|uniref:MOSC domain-containing protein n=1 Tax=Herbihabitans rhizosphaerae TaxID=1872711 RepID=A0A4Q7KSJ2_9PSEU|nr:MOSC domain-containing protein [Herbihabitans rhizosphaerae]RZS39090.1 MOSC domain-containing protein [Herbihabitans rhizosphaerae]